MIVVWIVAVDGGCSWNVADSDFVVAYHGACVWTLIEMKLRDECSDYRIEIVVVVDVNMI